MVLFMLGFRDSALVDFVLLNTVVPFLNGCHIQSCQQFVYQRMVIYSLAHSHFPSIPQPSRSHVRSHNCIRGYYPDGYIPYVI